MKNVKLADILLKAYTAITVIPSFLFCLSYAATAAISQLRLLFSTITPLPAPEDETRRDNYKIWPTALAGEHWQCQKKHSHWLRHGNFNSQPIGSERVPEMSVIAHSTQHAPLRCAAGCPNTCQSGGGILIVTSRTISHTVQHTSTHSHTYTQAQGCSFSFTNTHLIGSLRGSQRVLNGLSV